MLTVLQFAFNKLPSPFHSALRYVKAFTSTLLSKFHFTSKKALFEAAHFQLLKVSIRDFQLKIFCFEVHH